jgi:hypothetical protein
MTTIPRDGVCVCGVPVKRHFTAANEKLPCELAKGRPMEMDGWTLLAVVESDKGGKSYELRQDPADAMIGCSCPAFAFRLRCKHVERYEAQQASA